MVSHRDVRVLPLDGFEPMIMGIVWRGEPAPLVRALVEETQNYARTTWPQWAVQEKLA
ncbi:MAG: hypothetical protein ABIS43_03795 [Opitutus sp.]